MSRTHLFFLNGQKYIVPSNLTISDLIDYFGYNKSLLVVEYNQFVCNKTEWNKIFVQTNDTIEFVTIVGGG
jgi:thiamine biosynthesis protein ThiS